jgi:4'-phosphopantetheinyl transferase EntD
VKGANAAHPSALLAELFSPLRVAASELRGTANPAMLLPEEAAACESFRIKRLEEFAAGRLCARGALGQFGLGCFPVCRNPDRTPQWPDGFVGSITHTVGYCGAVAGTRDRFAGLGIDAEIVARVTPDVWSQALTEDDKEHVLCMASAERDRTAAVIFSAKEAFYKCQSSVSGCWLDYVDVSVEVVAESPCAGEFLVRSATPAAHSVFADFVARGRYRVTDGLVVAGVALTPDDVKSFSTVGLGIAS